MKKPSTQMYHLLSFQYKPIERELKSSVTPEVWSKYSRMSATKKIAILDRIASGRGL